MKVKAKYLRVLIDALIKKHEQTRDRKALEQIAEEVEGITSDYLYKKIVQPISKMKDTAELGLRDAMVIALVQHLGYKDVKAFVDALDHPVSTQLESCAGTYYTYLRKNTMEGFLLRSPVKIYRDKNQMTMELRGPRMCYSGELKICQGYLYVLLSSAGGKQFYHGYKIGTMERPQVLQGIFSGVTSGFDPIGGRVVLVRIEDERYESLTLQQVSIDELIDSVKKEDQALGRYLERQEENNLSIRNTTSFGFGDL